MPSTIEGISSLSMSQAAQQVDASWTTRAEDYGTKAIITFVIEYCNIMVRHGTAKKRRSGVKVSRKVLRPLAIKIASKITNPLVKQHYNKGLTPAQNLHNLGLVSDANNVECLKDPSNPDPKFKAFVGYTEVTKQKKIKKLDEIQLLYAKKCIKVYGNDYETMSKDFVINYNQMTAAKLKRLCTRYIEQQDVTNV